MHAKVLLEVKGLSVVYPGPPPYLAVKQVCFSVQRGEKLVLIGQSGCGKTTVLKAIGGFIKPAEGAVYLEGKPVSEPGPDRPMVFQDFDQHFPWYTVLENLVYALKITGKARDKKDAQEKAKFYLNLVGVEAAAHKYPHELSGGMKQRVAIARSLALEPKVLLMDEPFAALDAILRTKLQHELEALWEKLGFTLVLITHSIQEAVYLGDRVLVMSSNPGTVREIVDVSQVRDLSSRAFSEAASYLRSLLLPTEQYVREEET
ncbi:MAG: ABC transporter ATP-binding protein [Candidatus Bathyarchaeia archaeon]